MSKNDLKSLNDLYFRWWKDEVNANKEMLKDIASLRAENATLKRMIYENSIQTGRRTRKKVKKKKVRSGS